MARNRYVKTKHTDQKTFLANETELRKLASKLRRARQAYYNTGQPIMTDTEYDRLENKLRKMSPQHPLLKSVGSSPTDRKTRLPYTMASLNKITESEAIARWIKSNAGPYIVSDKLDGVSAMHVFDHSTNTEGLYTRGNGLTGSDITHMLTSIPSIGNGPKGLKAVRGELIISKSSFNRRYAQEYQNPRNFASGIVNATRSIKSGVSDLNFFVHSVVAPEIFLDKAKTKLLNAGYSVVPFVKRSKLDELWLLEYLAERRKKSNYEIDGLVITAGSMDSIAFKAGYEMEQGVVKEVIWSPTRYGFLKPVVVLAKGLRLAGVTINRVSAHNAKFVVDNKLGKGAIVNVVRSGEVIPKIASVEKPATRAQLPTEYTYSWNSTKVDFVIDDMGIDEVVVRQLTEFLVKIGVDRIKDAQVKLLVEKGIDTIPELLSASTQDFYQAGMGEVMSSHLYNKMHDRMKRVDLATLMSASGLFGRGMGKTRIDTILNEVPYRNQVSILKGQSAKLQRRLADVPGVGTTTSMDYIKGLRKFVKFVNAIGWKPQRVARTVTKVSKLGPSPIVVFTGFRDQALTERLAMFGGKHSNSVTKNTTHVVAISPNAKSTKLAKARLLGIPILSVSEFERKLR